MKFNNLHIQIILYNSEDKLKGFVQSFQIVEIPKEMNITFHFVKHDKNRSEDYLDIIKGLNRFTFTFDENENIGFGAGHNWLFKKYHETYDEFFMVLNPDTILFLDAFSNLSKYQLENVGALEFSQFPREHPKSFDPISFETEWISGASTIINNEAFKNVNGFDEAYFMYYEDLDLSVRIRDTGYRLYHLPNCRVGHFIASSSKSQEEENDSSFSIINMQAGQLYFIKKFGIKDSDSIEWISKKSQYKTEVRTLFEKMSKNIILYKSKLKLDKDIYTKQRW